MLSFFFLKQRYTNYVKNNFFLDYGLKYLAKIFVYNVHIQLAYFFAEKFMIEYFTRYAFNYTGLAASRSIFNLSHSFMGYYLTLAAINVYLLFV